MEEFKNELDIGVHAFNERTMIEPLVKALSIAKKSKTPSVFVEVPVTISLTTIISFFITVRQRYDKNRTKI